ncbi:MAG: hypothetical protein V1752_01010 [Candidatus Firestonebacteria bacterium]
MAKKTPVLFKDTLNGTAAGSWIIAPKDFRSWPWGCLCLLDTAARKKRQALPKVGDQSWSKYRVEFDFLPKSLKGYTGLNFHVQSNGDACNLHFPSGASGRNEAFQTMYIYGKSMSWKLYPESQGYGLFRGDSWSHLRLDVGKTLANLFVNGAPVLTMFDLPFNAGGIEFWSYYGQVYIRNVTVIDLTYSRVVPVFKNPWLIYKDADVLKDWRVALCKDQKGEGIPLSSKLDWRDIQADSRGVVNLSRAFREDNTRNTAWATAEIIMERPETKKLFLTYTDRLTIWCNNRKVFTGEPRGWNDPNRDAHFGGRLIPDEYYTNLRLVKGKNRLLVRSEVIDPWGWGFWMRTK